MMPARLSGRAIHIRGIVQGVGFRPLVYTYAHKLELTGWIRNSGIGVEIEVYGPEGSLLQFINQIKTSPPSRSRIDSFAVKRIPFTPYQGFSISESQESSSEYLPVSPDLGVCKDCTEELFDPQNRRFRYPFINCVNCGPRFTIVQSIPYDRPRTTMSGFPMCPDCEKEYKDPLNRRFHAQPIACPICGPAVAFVRDRKKRADGEEAIQSSRDLLRNGGILAVKSLGGYQLACDATNPAAVAALRERKQRIQKPFALMAADISIVEKYCQLDDADRTLITSPQGPILLACKRKDCSMTEEIAPRQNTYGIMLPYTPLHHLLLEPAPGFPEIFVMTSGNLSEEPIAYEDGYAIEYLERLADAFLTHDRPIHMRTDDSVLRIFRGASYPIRRARGYAPDPLQIPDLPIPVLAAGSDLKNTFCLARDNYAFMSHHIGDLENYETTMAYESAIEHFKNLFNTEPRLIACDLHPDYFSSTFARSTALRSHIPLVEVQHHHAHLASCLADNQFAGGNVIGLIFDGTGFGADGWIWGGEILTGNYYGFERAYHLEYLRLPGGDSATRHVSRTAYAYLQQSDVDCSTGLFLERLPREVQEVISKQIQQGVNAPYTSSMGRLFDAVSAMIGICAEATYEGQAAIELEMSSDVSEQGRYPMPIGKGIIHILPMLRMIYEEMRSGVAASKIAMRFHNTILSMSVMACEEIRKKQHIKTVALSGGVWQNRLLLEATVDRLSRKGFKVLWHHQVPTNDGGLSLGQVMIASRMYKGE